MIRYQDNLLSRLQSQFSEILLDTRDAFGEVTITVLARDILSVSQVLHDEFGFSQLIDLCGVDYLHYEQVEWKTRQSTSTGYSRGVARSENDTRTASLNGKPRFAVVYHLLSIKHNQRLRIRTFADGEPPRVYSVVDIWNSANWYEREAFDLFGILFDGHPDLRRILTDYGFVGHPFRKDFPLNGYVEMRYDPQKRRVVYQPVSIENRVLVPKVIRQDNRYNAEAAETNHATT